MIGKIGRYEVESLSGVGGMGAVYRAFDPQLKRRVAIKEVVSELLRDPRYVQRFEEEARLLARIGDPRVVTVHDFFQEGGKYYMVMEYVEGEPLSTHVRDPRLSGPEIQAILLDIAYGLRAVHRLGVVHRDIKPKNVLLTSERKVKIADFGIAKLMEKEPTIPEGTAKYLAPEVLEGAAVDGRTDIYSLGVLAYEMFLGDKRFNELFPEVYGTGGDLDLKWKSWHLDRTKRLKPLNEYGVTLSPWVAAVLARAVDKDAGVRYQTIDALIKDLEVARGVDSPTRRLAGIFASPATAVSAPGGARPAAPPAKGSRALLAVAAVALALAAGLFTAALWVRRDPPTERTPGVARPNVQDAIERVRRLLREGRFDRAQDALNEALKQFPGQAALVALSDDIERERQRRTDEASREAEYRKWFELGRRREEAGELAGAAQAYGEADEVRSTPEVREAIARVAARLAAAQAAAQPPRGKGVLMVDSLPPGAAVFVDGEGAGATPLQLPLEAGAHRVRLSLRFHEDREFAAEIVAGEVLRKAVELAAARGRLTLVTDPPAARVFVDHDWLPMPSPATVDLPAGQHYVWTEKGDLGAEATAFVDGPPAPPSFLELPLQRRGRPERVAARELDRERQDLLDRAQVHVERQEWKPAAELLEKALKLREAPDARRRLQEVRARLAMEESHRREAAGDFAGALAVCEPLLESADFPELRRALSRLRHKQAGLVLVPAGPFTLGGDGPDAEADERPVQRVHLDAFLIERAEVTNARYAEFLEDLARTKDHSRCHPDEPKGRDHAPSNWGTPAYAEYSPTPEHPVVQVDWFDAYAYAAWARMRLPTEAEWEKAAGHDPVTGEKRTWPWGGKWDARKCNAEWAFDRFERAAPVGSFPEGASGSGALDMAGNVWEWCADWYDIAYPAPGAEPRRNPAGPAAGTHRVVRGGSWIDGKASLRVANRLRNLPGDRWDKLGFRCVQERR